MSLLCNAREWMLCALRAIASFGLGALALACTATPAMADPTLTVRLAHSGMPANPLIVYRRELIELALRAAGYRPDVRACDLPGGKVSDRRLIAEVHEGQRCDLLATSSGGEASRALRLVPVPIYLGGGDLRVWLMNRASLARLEASQDDDLHRMHLGSGGAWSDTRVWEMNGYVVEKADYDSLFRMLAAGHVDAMPRSVFEITAEYDNLDPTVFAIEPHRFFRMQTGIFFYVSPTGVRLSRALERGMRRLYCSGEFERFMRTQASTRSAFHSLQFEQRRIIELTTPELPAEEARALREYVPSWVDGGARARECGGH